MSPAPDPNLLAALLARRSVRPRRLVMPGPGDDALAQIVSAGQRGIDHGNLRPWRLIHIQDRHCLAEAFEAADRELSSGTNGIDPEKARARAYAGPVVLALVACVTDDHVDAPAYEQWIAIGAAVQQMLLAANALGFAGSILSGRKTRSRALRTAFNLAENEQLVGFLTFGTAQQGTATPPITAPTAPPVKLSRWPS